MTLTATTSHTVGPYYHIGLTWLNREDLTVAQTLGQRVAITGQVVDGNGQFVNDAMLEVWQANAAGKYAHPEDDQDKPWTRTSKALAGCRWMPKGASDSPPSSRALCQG